MADKKFDEHRHEQLSRKLDAVNELSKKTEMNRAQNEEGPIRVLVCLSDGRCLIPDPTDGSIKSCPFCVVLPPGCQAADRKAELMSRIERGH